MFKKGATLIGLLGLITGPASLFLGLVRSSGNLEIAGGAMWSAAVVVLLFIPDR